MNEVPLCELALSCDNLLCDAHGRPPSPLVVIYVRFSKHLSVRYGSTETVEVLILRYYFKLREYSSFTGINLLFDNQTLR